MSELFKLFDAPPSYVRLSDIATIKVVDRRAMTAGGYANVTDACVILSSASGFPLVQADAKTMQEAEAFVAAIVAAIEAGAQPRKISPGHDYARETPAGDGTAPGAAT